MSTLSTLEANSLKGALEALLLVSSDPVSAPALAGALDIAPGECASLLAELKVEYEEANRGFQLREVAGGWRLFTHPAYHDVVEAYVLSWDTQKLSQAALETLAVIAYHQPVTREVVKGIRGVNSDGVIASLVDKGLVRELGRDPQRGQAIIYGTTNAFLEKFGLRSTRDLPDLEQFAPDEQSRQFIRERLSGRSIQSTLEEQAEDLDEERELLDTDVEDVEAVEDLETLVVDESPVLARDLGDIVDRTGQSCAQVLPVDVLDAATIQGDAVLLGQKIKLSSHFGVGAIKIEELDCDGRNVDLVLKAHLDDRIGRFGVEAQDCDIGIRPLDDRLAIGLEDDAVLPDSGKLADVLADIVDMADGADDINPLLDHVADRQRASGAHAENYSLDLLLTHSFLLSLQKHFLNSRFVVNYERLHHAG